MVLWGTILHLTLLGTKARCLSVTATLRPGGARGTSQLTAGLHGKGWCQSLHTVIVIRRRHPHEVLKGCWIFVTQIDHETVVKPQPRSLCNPVTQTDIPYYPPTPPPPSSSSSFSSSFSSFSLSEGMLGLYQLVLLVPEHTNENIIPLNVHVQPLTSNLRVQKSKPMAVFIRSKIDDKCYMVYYAGNIRF
ncbi:hypothetical protein DPMN_141072 [Dreissena polymorpha]|uniref:Uncharacterized protein n=1 Tax=Dreissena polymorpha TaxID=45954 RepID=A0A9D4GC02_DREPO|nr:hypothetical protein DPMN_141072 [Dreissena polymorpha]